MQRYFALDKNLTLSNKDLHHIVNVMRMKKNDNIEVVYDEEVFLCSLTNVTKEKVEYEIIKKQNTSSELSKKVIIAFPLVTENKMDFMLQKCTELGAYEFIIYNSSRSKVKVNEKINKKLDRWNLIVKEACEQSFRNYLPKVYGIKTLEDLINYKCDLRLVASTKNNKKSLKNILQNSTNYDRIIIVVGPEGGLDEKEEELLLKSGYEAVTFGDSILRCETAPMFIMSAIKYETMR